MIRTPGVARNTTPGHVVLLLAASCSGRAPALEVTSPGEVTHPPATSPNGPAPLVDVPPAALCTTSGAVVPRGARLHVEAGAMRAVVHGSSGRAAEIEFVYRGPSLEAAPLANGELRQQVGLKLRAQNTCNVVYVMWEIEPRARIVVSVKHNRGLSTHAECGASGYSVMRPRVRRDAPASIGQGEHHTLRAELIDGLLIVTADGQRVWEGDLPPEALAFDGPAGIRTDNATFDLTLRVRRGKRTLAACAR